MTPTKKRIEEKFNIHKTNGGLSLDNKLQILFDFFNDQKCYEEIKIKVSVLNKIYSTSIVHIDPVVEKILSESNFIDFCLSGKKEFRFLVDKISKVKWKNQKGNEYQRNNISFSSKYVHFLSDRKTPIYDSYIWILVNGYIGQKLNKKITFSPPKSYLQFYEKYEEFKSLFQLNGIENYTIDKYLWIYGKKILDDLTDKNTSLDKSKRLLKQELNNYISMK